MLLSIGMIVKNEEKYLRRCLDALSPILQQVDSELIIADTGSGDKTADIAGEFTDNVFHFDWRDDFAAARNSTMQRAKGSWFMSIDADEILNDTKELVEFFNSGEFEKYNSATYIIRSANDAGLRRSSDFNAVRLIKRQSDSFFIHPVHEQFGRIYGPVKNLSVVASHYGYVTENNEDVIAYKMKRNLRIMLSELDKNPKDSMLYLNISNAYKLLNEYEKALEYCEKGLKSSDNKVRHPLLSSSISINVYLGRYLKAVEIADEYFRSKPAKIGTDLEVYYMKAESCLYLGRNKEAIQAYQEYISFFKEFKQGMHNTVDTYQHSVIHTDDGSYRTAVLNLTKLLAEEKEFKTARSCLRTVPADGFLQDTNKVSFWLELEIHVMKKLNDFSGIADLCERLDGYALEEIQKLIEKELKQEARRGLILKEFAALGQPKHNYSWLMKLRSDYSAGKMDAERLKEFISGLEEWTPLFADAAYIALKAGLPVQSIAKKMNAYDVGRFFYYNEYFCFDDLAYLVYEICTDPAEQTDTHTQMWVSFLYFLELTSDRMREDHIAGMFKAYSKTAFHSMAAIFKEEIMTEENADILPLQFRIGFYCHMATCALETGEDFKYLKYLRETLKLCPQLKKVVEILADQFQKALNGVANRQSEFEAYAARVKDVIRGLIDGGKTNEAEEFIKRYESLCPADSEIAELKNNIASMTRENL